MRRIDEFSDAAQDAGPDTQRAEEWLGLGEAARLLGVTPNTLRRWTDRGHVGSFTTPGGHRRFARATIEALLPPSRSRRPHLADLGASGARIAAAYRRTSPGGDAASWLDGIGEDERQRFRERGRRMVECLLAHLDADTPGPALANLREASDHAVDYGAQTAALGASLSEAIDAFVRFRQPFVEQLAETARSRGLDTREAIELLTDAESANDRLLVAFVDGWQRGEMTA